MKKFKTALSFICFISMGLLYLVVSANSLLAKFLIFELERIITCLECWIDDVDYKFGTPNPVSPCDIKAWYNRFWGLNYYDGFH